MHEIIFYLRKCFIYFEKCKIEFFIKIMLNLLTSLLSLIEPYLYSLIITYLYTKDFFYIKNLLIIILAIHIVKISLQIASKKLELDIRKKIAINSKNRILSNLTMLRPSKIIRYNEGKLISILYTDTVSIWRYVDTVSKSIIDILSIILIACIIVRMDIVLSIISIIFYPIIYFLYSYFGKKIKKLNIKSYRLNDNFLMLLKSIIENINEIIVNSYDNKIKNYFNSIANDTIDQNNACEKMQLKATVINDLLCILQYILLLSFGVYFVFINRLSVTLFIAFSSYSKLLNSSLLKISSLNSLLQSQIVSIERILEFMNFSNDAINYENEKKLIGSLNKGIILNDTTLKFKTIIFEELNLKFGENSKTAIIGSNGSGKTSLLNMLCGIYEQSNGEVYFGNSCFVDLNFLIVKKDITYVKQNSMLLNISIIENILLFNNSENIEFSDIVQVCKDVNIYNDIINMPEQFHTIVGNTYKLSSGQIQKLQLARAILKKSKVVLFDEPTSNLDDESKKCFYLCCEKYLKNSIIIIATHDMQYKNFYTKIYKIEEGLMKEIK